MIKKFYGKGWQNFSVKGQILNSLGFVGHMMAFVQTTQLCHYNAKADIDNGE